MATAPRESKETLGTPQLPRVLRAGVLRVSRATLAPSPRRSPHDASTTSASLLRSGFASALARAQQKSCKATLHTSRDNTSSMSVATVLQAQVHESVQTSYAWRQLKCNQVSGGGGKRLPITGGRRPSGAARIQDRSPKHKRLIVRIPLSGEIEIGTKGFWAERGQSPNAVANWGHVGGTDRPYSHIGWL